MRIFLEKNCNNRLIVGGSAPEPLFSSSDLGLRPRTSALSLPRTKLLQLYRVRFQRLMRFIILKKEQNNCCKCFASSTILHLFLPSNFVFFVDKGRKNISFSRGGGDVTNCNLLELQHEFVTSGFQRPDLTYIFSNC